MELIDYKITEGGVYGWQCYGPNSYMLSSWNGVHGSGGYNFNIVFSTKTQKVYEVEVCDYTNDRAYRMINPDYIKKQKKESKRRGTDSKYAWDYVEYVDLDVVEDFLEKAQAIKEGKEYDTSVMMSLDLPDDVILQAALAAHKDNVTLNDYINKALATLAHRVQNGELTKEDADKFKAEIS